MTFGRHVLLLHELGDSAAAAVDEGSWLDEDDVSVAYPSATGEGVALEEAARLHFDVVALGQRSMTQKPTLWR